MPGRFRLEKELARGGMGVVYAAVDQQTGARIAVKRLLPGASETLAGFFEREFYVLSSLRHPRIIEVYEYGIDEQGAFYTMELLDGSDLREVAPVEVAMACRYLRDVASSLALLHARRLLHRDVSPRNVRVLPDGGCKLFDFGALAAFGIVEDILGTPPGIAPENLFGQPLDQRADLFSLGALAYWLLTGKHAYPARRVSDLMEAWTVRPPPPSFHVPGVPPELDQLVMSLLSFEVLSRPTSASDVIDQLTTIAGLEPERNERARAAYFVGTSLVERERELSRITRRITRLKAGRGGAVFMDSEPGSGKTRLLGECVLKAQLSGVTVLGADALPASAPFATALVLLRNLRQVAPDLVSRLLAADAALIEPLLAPVSAVHTVPGASQHPRADFEPARIARVIEACLVEASRELPLCIAVDNVDRADAHSSALLLSLARATKRERLLVIATALARPSSEHGSATRGMRDASSVLRIRDLSEAGVQTLVRSAFGDVPHVRRTAKRLFFATGGNPQHCLMLLQSWLEAGIIGYLDGSWMLPFEIPSRSVLRAERMVADRVRRCSERASALASLLAVMERPASLPLCTALLGDGDRFEAIAALEELVASDVLSPSGAGYYFRHDALRQALIQELAPDALASLHARIGRALLALFPDDPTMKIRAGRHLIQSGAETEGAELVARSARRGLNGGDFNRTLVHAVPDLEAALEAYRRQGRSNLELLDLLVPLVLSSYDHSYELAARYGEETLGRLERALGLEPSDPSRPAMAAPAVFAALSAAPHLEAEETRSERTPDVVVLVTWLTHVVMTLMGVAGTVIDHRAQTRYAAVLRPFLALGPEHPTAVACEYSGLLKSMTEDRMSVAYRAWSEMLERLPRLGLPYGVRRRLEVGATMSLGILESQRDDDGMLERVAVFEGLAYSQRAAAANQLRFLYHGFRGELDEAEKCRDRVEEYALSHGAAWQVEMWSTCTMSAVYGNTRDAVGARRVAEQLERLKDRVPALTLYWKRAQATHLLLSGRYDRAIATYRETLGDPDARERIGSTAVAGALALAHNRLGQHAAALELCRDAIERATEDRDYVAMTLSVWIEHCIALAGLGRHDEAKASLDELFAYHEPRQNPMTLGSLHRTGAEMALMGRDLASFDRHIARMEDWYRRTKNPALIAQCEKLRNQTGRISSAQATESVLGASFSTMGTSVASRSVLASCHGAEERQRRVLELVAERAGTGTAWLFTLSTESEPLLSSNVGTEHVPADVLAEVQRVFHDYLSEAEETDYVEPNRAASGTFSVAEPQRPFQVIPLTITRGTSMFLAGAIAIKIGPAPRPINHGFVQELALQLYEAGDIESVRVLI